MTGVVPAGGEASVTVKYRPVAGGAADCMYKLAVEGGSGGADAPVLHVTGEEVDAALAAELGATADGNVEFGTLAVGASKEHPIVLRNTGTTAAVVTLQVSDREGSRYCGDPRWPFC